MLISVIIPTHNRPEFLAEATQSVLRQSHQNIELLVVNDGSLPVARSDDRRVRVLDSKKSGAVPARNLGISAAKGEAIAWLDDDDVWTDPDFLTTVSQAISSGEDFVFGDGALIYPEARPAISFAHDADIDTLRQNNTILISAVCYRADLHQTLGPMDEALPYYWDWDWYLRVARAGHRLRRIKRPVVNIRIHPDNMSGQSNLQPRQQNLALLAQKHDLKKLELKSHADFI